MTLKRAPVLVLACLLGLGVYAAPLLRAQQTDPLAPTQRQAPGPVVTVPGTTPPVSPTVPSQPAVSVTEVKSPAAPAHYGDQAIWALMISFVIQYLKKSPWFGWVTPASTARLKAQFGFLAALLTAAGIHFAVSGSIFDGGGASITVTGLSLNAFKDIAWQWAAQQGWYLGLVKEPKEVIAVAAAGVPAVAPVVVLPRAQP